MYRYFFKFFFLFPICISSYSIRAQQRICDLEAICISPGDTIVNGGTLLLRFGRKNLGPDNMFKNDTTYYRLYRMIGGQKKVDYSGAFIGGGGRNETVSIGDSTIYRDNYEISFNYPDLKEPLVLEYCVQIDSWKRNAWGDTIGFSYYDTNAGNNTCCKQVVVMPQLVTNIIASGVKSDALLLYPNPARDILYMQMNKTWDNRVFQAVVRDVKGTILLKHYYQSGAGAGAVSLNVDQLPPGIYILNLQSETECITKRFTVFR